MSNTVDTFSIIEQISTPRVYTIDNLVSGLQSLLDHSKGILNRFTVIVDETHSINFTGKALFYIPINNWVSFDHCNLRYSYVS